MLRAEGVPAVRTQIWNCGGGTQSAAIAALIAAGTLSPPDIAVIVDTERERSSTWRYVDQWIAPALRNVGITLHRVPKSRYATVDVWGGKDGKALLIPAFTDQGDDVGKLPAFCSMEWKARVVQRWATLEHGVTAATNWIGFSTDEANRAQNVLAGKWQRYYPLIELGHSRSACYGIVRRAGWPQPPRSSCWMCPNHSDAEWTEIKRDDPLDFAKALAFGAEIRERDPHAWLHQSCEPLDQVDFGNDQGNLFECKSGLCFT
jgi:hypothetical protein